MSLWRVFPYQPHLRASIWVAGVFTNMDQIGPPYDKHRLAYSYDGITWYQNMIAEYEALGICYNGKKFVAVGADPNPPYYHGAAYSIDGINWTMVDERNTRNCVVWTGTRFISAGMGEYGHWERTVSDSPDGVTWRVQSVSKVENPAAIASNMNTVVIGGNNYGYGFNDSLMYSIDGGIHWTGLGATIFTQWCYGLATNGAIWVGGGQGTNTLAYSYDGITWHGLGNSVFSEWAWAICWNGTMFVAVGEGSVAGSNMIAYSYDGINWTGLGDPLGFKRHAQHSGQTIVWDGEKFVIGGTDFAFPHDADNTLGYSADGLSWVGSGLQFPHWCSMAANNEPRLVPPV